MLPPIVSVVALLSIFACCLVLFSYSHDKRLRSSTHFAYVARLCLCDAASAVFVVVWNIILRFADDETTHTLCYIHHPISLIFWLCSVFWTMRIAERFLRVTRYTNDPERLKADPLWHIWVAAAVLAVPTMFMNAISPRVSKVSHRSEYDQCGFGRSTAGIVVMSLFFTVPLIVCIFLNCYFYFAGLRALRYSPEAVIMSRARRATGYMGVLMIVWVPNLVITLMFQHGHNVSNSVHSTGVFLIAAQGLLDSMVYGLNTKELQRFVHGVLCCTHSASAGDPNDVPYPHYDASVHDVSALNAPLTRMTSFTPGVSDYDPRLTNAGATPPEPIPRQSENRAMVAGSLGKLVRFGKKKDMTQVHVFQNMSPVQSPMHEIMMEEGQEEDDEDEGEDETIANMRPSRFARMGTPRRPHHMHRSQQQHPGF